MWVARDEFGDMNLEKIRGTQVKLERMNKRHDRWVLEFWRNWDQAAGFERADEEAEERLPEVGFRRVEFVNGG